MSDDKSKEDRLDDTKVHLDDVHFAELERSLITLADSWESAESLSADDMIKHLEEVINVFDGVGGFSEFIKKTGFKIRNNS